MNVADNIIPSNKPIEIWYVIFKKPNFMFLMDEINMP